jgi:hypothetical protein
MAERGRPKRNVSGKGEKRGQRTGAGIARSKAGDAAARAKHGTQGGAAASPREDSPRVPSGRSGGPGGGRKGR